MKTDRDLAILAGMDLGVDYTVAVLARRHDISPGAMGRVLDRLVWRKYLVKREYGGRCAYVNPVIEVKPGGKEWSMPQQQRERYEECRAARRAIESKFD
jgi:hypothetical protein